MSRKPTSAAAAIIDWLIAQALGVTTPAALLEGVALRLRDEGVPIERAHMSYTTLHPLHRGAGATWTREVGIEEEGYGHEPAPGGGGWLQSPIRHAILSEAGRVRRRLAGPGEMRDFPVLEELAARGYTDYFLVACAFDSFFAPIDATDAATAQSGMAVSFATARAGGFSHEEIETLDWLSKPMAMVVKTANQRLVAESIARCYIGREAGPRVLGGAIRRGDFATTEAVVWLSDLRDSTEMSMTLPRGAYIAAMNEFFEATAGAVEAEGGETLTFIGDGALAIFPVEALGAEGARRAALAAAARAAENVAALNAIAGRRRLGWGLALHAGALDYGNLGSRTRHSWSVVGPVVNETARLEGVTKRAGEPLVVSRAFLAALPEAARWRPLGAFDLAGVPAPFEAFAPPLAAAEEAA